MSFDVVMKKYYRISVLMIIEKNGLREEILVLDKTGMEKLILGSHSAPLSTPASTK